MIFYHNFDKYTTINAHPPTSIFPQSLEFKTATRLMFYWVAPSFKDIFDLPLQNFMLFRARAMCNDFNRLSPRIRLIWCWRSHGGRNSIGSSLGTALLHSANNDWTRSYTFCEIEFFFRNERRLGLAFEQYKLISYFSGAIMNFKLSFLKVYSLFFHYALYLSEMLQLSM